MILNARTNQAFYFHRFSLVLHKVTCSKKHLVLCCFCQAPWWCGRHLEEKKKHWPGGLDSVICCPLLLLLLR